MFLRGIINGPVFDADNGGGSGGAATDDNKSGTGGGQADGGGTGGTGADQGTPWYDRHDWIKNDGTQLVIAKKYGDEATALKAGFNAQRMIGYEKVPIPKTEADWQNWFDAAGRPKSPDEYKFSEVKLPDGMALDEKLDGSFKTAAHKLGLNPAQADGLRKMFAEYQASQFTDAGKANETAKNEATAKLQQEWGQAFEGQKALAITAMKHYMSPELVAELEATGLGNNVELIRTFNKIGKELVGENKIKLPGTGQGGDTPAELDAQMIEFRQKHKDALASRQHPENELRTKELTALFERRYPTKAA